MTSKESQKWEQKRYKEMLEDLKKIKEIYVLGLRKSVNPNWDEGHWRYFGVYYVKDNKLERVFIYHSLRESQKPSYWDQETNSFKCVALGTSRDHEIIYSLYHKVYPKSRDVLHKMPEIRFLSYFDGNSDDLDELEREEGEP